MKKALIIIVFIIGALIIGGLFLPTEYKIKREIEVKAGSQKLYELIGELKNWDVWSPWKEQDPTIQTTYGEKTSGVGATQSWIGEHSGNGRLEITKADPNSGVEYDLFFEDDKYKCTAGMVYEPSFDGDTYKLTWFMNGDMNMPIVGGYINLMMKSNLNEMFDQGLKKLKEVAEAAPPAE